MWWIPFATKQQPINDFHLDIEICFHVQRAEDKIRCPVIITTTVITVMVMNIRLLLFLLSLANEFLSFPQRFQECFSCVSSCSVLFWHFCQGAVWSGERGRGSRGWPWTWAGLLAADCTAAAATTLSLPPLHSRPPLISSLSALQLQPWTALRRNWLQSIPSRLSHIDLSPGPNEHLGSPF